MLGPKYSFVGSLEPYDAPNGAACIQVISEGFRGFQYGLLGQMILWGFKLLFISYSILIQNSCGGSSETFLWGFRPNFSNVIVGNIPHSITPSLKNILALKNNEQKFGTVAFKFT